MQTTPRKLKKRLVKSAASEALLPLGPEADRHMSRPNRKREQTVLARGGDTGGGGGVGRGRRGAEGKLKESQRRNENGKEREQENMGFKGKESTTEGEKLR